MPGKAFKKIFSLKGRRHLPWWVRIPLAWGVKLIIFTCRKTVIDPDGLLRKKGCWPLILTLWHNRLLFLIAMTPKVCRRNSVGLASVSRDGEYAADLLRAFSMGAIRGSSSKRGTEALRDMKKAIDSGLSVGITLDGPRGPRYSVHPGAVGLARLTGAPVVPLILNAPRRWELRSWDRTQIPKPFSRITLVVGTPLEFPRDAAAESREHANERLRQAMLAVTDDSGIDYPEPPAVSETLPHKTKETQEIS